MFFHTELSEQLLVRLCEKKKMDDLVLTLFQVIFNFHIISHIVTTVTRARLPAFAT